MVFYKAMVGCIIWSSYPGTDFKLSPVTVKSLFSKQWLKDRKYQPENYENNCNNK